MALLNNPNGNSIMWSSCEIDKHLFLYYLKVVLVVLGHIIDANRANTSSQGKRIINIL